MEDLEQAELSIASLIANNRKLTARVKQLEEEVKFLDCLTACGVDNWEGYDHAQKMMEEDDG